MQLLPRPPKAGLAPVKETVSGAPARADRQVEKEGQKAQNVVRKMTAGRQVPSTRQIST
jgi:hypothetical protein